MPNFVEKHPTPMPTKHEYGKSEFYRDLETLKKMADNLSRIYSRVQGENKQLNVSADSISAKRKEYDELRNSIVEKVRKGIETSTEEQDKLNSIVKWIDGRRPTELLDNLQYIEDVLQDLSKDNSER